MDLGTYLSQNWALIAANPVPFLTLGVLAATLGWGAAALLFRQRLDSLKERAEFWKERAELAEGKPVRPDQDPRDDAKPAVDPPTAPPPAAFLPSAVQTRIIRVLRQLDGQFLSIGDLARFAGSTSHQDLVDDIHGLHDKGWLEAERHNDLKREHGRAYRLKGPGLAFARASGFQTAHQMQLAGHPDGKADARPEQGQDA
jgi:hypothetical protein